MDNGRVGGELKALESLRPVHEASVLTYLRLSGCRIELSLNFNVLVQKDGFRRLVVCMAYLQSFNTEKIWSVLRYEARD